MHEPLSPALLLAAALAGAIVGLGADRLAARWPAHDAGVVSRGLDWRTLVVTLTGVVVGGALPARWGPPGSEVLALAAVLLLVLLAIDLDQRLLPNLLTYPLIIIAAALMVAGINPLLPTGTAGFVSAVATAVGAPLFLLLTDRLMGGGLGGGDVKLAIGVGLLAGISRFMLGFVIASVGFSLLLLALMAARRLGRKAFVPFGPVLVYAAFIAMLAP